MKSSYTDKSPNGPFKAKSKNKGGVKVIWENNGYSNRIDPGVSNHTLDTKGSGKPLTPMAANSKLNKKSKI